MSASCSCPLLYCFLLLFLESLYIWGIFFVCVISCTYFSQLLILLLFLKFYFYTGWNISFFCSQQSVFPLISSGLRVGKSFSILVLQKFAHICFLYSYDFFPFFPTFQFLTRLMCRVGNKSAFCLLSCGYFDTPEHIFKNPAYPHKFELTTLLYIKRVYVIGTIYGFSVVFHSSVYSCTNATLF